jgi:pimeloyl-ACP methyl ester carboxylesterase
MISSDDGYGTTMTDAIPTAPIADAETAQVLLERLDRTARHWETPCGDGTMVWRGWGSGPAVLLVHGGAGSWRHWVRNLAALSRDHTVIAPDLPGLGDSARAPDPIGAESVAAIVGQGLDTVLGPDVPVHIAGFSYGGGIAGLVAANADERVRSLTLIGTGGLGPPNRSVELVRVRDKTGAERLEAHRENLLRMMLADPANVDALALEIQEQNSKRARLNSGFMWISRVLHDALPRVHGHVHAFWGEHEMTDRAMLETRIALLRQARPDVVVEIVPKAGHWLFYEAAEHFNAALLRILAM